MKSIKTASGNVYAVIGVSRKGTPMVNVRGERMYFVGVNPTRCGLVEKYLGQKLERRTDGVLALNGHGFRPGPPRVGWNAMLVHPETGIRRLTTKVVEVE
jgi:hypothetical protein